MVRIRYRAGIVFRPRASGCAGDQQGHVVGMFSQSRLDDLYCTLGHTGEYVQTPEARTGFGTIRRQIDDGLIKAYGITQLAELLRRLTCQQQRRRILRRYLHRVAKLDVGVCVISLVQVRPPTLQVALEAGRSATTAGNHQDAGHDHQRAQDCLGSKHQHG
jgi:hypothetical protein